MKKILLLISVLGLTTIVMPAAVSHAADSPLRKACNNLSDAEKKESAACSTDGSNPVSGNTDSVLFKVTQLISVFAGVIAIIIIIVGGISMMTSGGDSQKFANGRNTVIFAAVGLIVVVIAQWLVAFAVNRFL